MTDCHSANKYQLLLLPLLISLVSCSLSTPPDHSQTSQTDTRQPGIWQTPSNPLSTNSNYAYAHEIDTLVKQLTLRQKVGQMVQPHLDAITPEEVREYHIGSVLVGGNGFAYNNRYATVADWVKLTDSYYHASMDTSNGRVAIPISWGIDAVHGHNKVVGATLFPHNIGLGATRNPDLLRQIGEVTALEMLVTGIDWNFAPSVAVVRDDRWGRTYESYSENPKLVNQLTGAYIEGLQGSITDGTFMDDRHVAATAKHFIGDGGTDQGIDRGDNRATEQALYDIHAAGYLSAIENGVLSVMPSHSRWQGRRLHGDHYLLTDVLKDRLGFDGMVIGDWNSHGLVKGCRNDNCPQAVNAGVDMFMVTHDWKDFINNTVAQVESGEITEARINDAVTRILRTKFRTGLFDKGSPSQRPFANRSELLGSQKHRQLARQAVRESLVLLKNNKRLLPLKPNNHILVCGDGADAIGKQNGGWTVSWSGKHAKKRDFPHGHSILEAVRQTVEAAGGTVEYNVKCRFDKQPDVAIVAFGEDPYAEWIGDIKHISYSRHNSRPLKQLKKLKEKKIPTVGLFISGRPLWVNPELNATDAFVALWLPGSEALGITDILFRQADGNIRYDFTGKLPFSWPNHPSQTTVNVGDKHYDPLFPYGFGLSYKNHDTPYPDLPLLPETDIPETERDPAQWIFEGRASIPWFMGLADQQGFTFYPGGIVESEHAQIHEIDRNTQGDAASVEWLGTSESALIFVNWEDPQNYTAYSQNKGAILIDLRLQQAPTASVHLSLGKMRPTESIDITQSIKALPQKQWQTLSVDLNCFSNVDFSAIQNTFTLSTTGKLALDLSHIRILPKKADTADIRCE